MADVQITVRGSSQSRHAPEQATVQLSVTVEGATADGVFGAVSQSAAALTAQVTALFDERTGPVTWWTSEQIRTWSHRPWNEARREELAPVHHAAVEFAVRFGDFAALSRWLSQAVLLTGVTVSGIEWSLTDALREQLTEASRAAAVLDARSKAASYARNLGLGEVRPVAIADLGLLEPTSPGDPGRRMPYMMASSTGGDQSVQFAPQDIVITASVDARFVA